MEVTMEDRHQDQAPGTTEESFSIVQNERLCIENLKFDERSRVCEIVRRRCRKRSKRKCKEEEMEFGRSAVQLVIDMTISRSCRYRLSVPVVFWTSVFLILLARGVNSVSDEHSRIIRSPKYEQETDAQGGLIPPNVSLQKPAQQQTPAPLQQKPAQQQTPAPLQQKPARQQTPAPQQQKPAPNSRVYLKIHFGFQETYNMMQFLRELIQRQQHRANQQQLQVYNNGEDLSDGQVDWKKVRLPLLHQIRSIINDGSKEEDKRGSYMSLCHFKICNLG